MSCNWAFKTIWHAGCYKCWNIVMKEELYAVWHANVISCVWLNLDLYNSVDAKGLHGRFDDSLALRLLHDQIDVQLACNSVSRATLYGVHALQSPIFKHTQVLGRLEDDRAWLSELSSPTATLQTPPNLAMLAALLFVRLNRHSFPSVGPWRV